jgi:hypothetical protein
MNTNRILARKNRGKILVEKLPIILNAPDSLGRLNGGDEFVYMKGNRVLNYGSPSARDEEIGRVLWHYGVMNSDKVIRKFELKEYHGYMVYYNKMTEEIVRKTVK